MIEHVIHLGSELKAEAFCQSHILRDVSLPVVDTGNALGIAAQITGSARPCRYAKELRFAPLYRNTLSLRQPVVDDALWIARTPGLPDGLKSARSSAPPSPSASWPLPIEYGTPLS
jgi:hypothetical protein